MEDMQIPKKVKQMTKKYTGKLRESSDVEAVFVIAIDDTDCFIDGFGSELHLAMAANTLLTVMLKKQLAINSGDEDEYEDEIVDP